MHPVLSPTLNHRAKVKVKSKRRPSKTKWTTVCWLTHVWVTPSSPLWASNAYFVSLSKRTIISRRTILPRLAHQGTAAKGHLVCNLEILEASDRPVASDSLGWECVEIACKDLHVYCLIVNTGSVVTQKKCSCWIEITHDVGGKKQLSYFIGQTLIRMSYNFFPLFWWVIKVWGFNKEGNGIKEIIK